MLSKFAGGLGNDWTLVRALGAYIKGTNGKAGIVPFLKVVNTRRWQSIRAESEKAPCVPTWRLGTSTSRNRAAEKHGDDRRRTHDMNTAN